MASIKFFEKVAVLLKLNTGAKSKFGFRKNVFIGKVNVHNDKLAILKYDGPIEPYNYFTINFVDIHKTIHRHDEIEFHIASGQIFLGFFLRREYSLKTLDEFLHCVRDKLKTPVVIEQMPRIQPPT